MNRTSWDHDAHEPRTYPAEKARQGQIILRSRGQRIIFLSGLIGPIVLFLVLWMTDVI